MEKPSPIITLTTDFGTSDVYVGVMKGVILNINPDAQIVDITHDIPPQDIHEAAFTIHAAQRYFPKGTIHIIVVDPGVGSNRQTIVCHTDNAFFVCPNNGVLSYVLQDVETENNPDTIAIDNPTYLMPKVSNTFHGRDIFAPIAAHLSLGVTMKEIGTPIHDLISLPLHTASISDNTLTGQIIKVDSFGNMITNISEEMLGLFLFSSTQNKTLEDELSKHANTINFEIRIGITCINKLNSSYAESEAGVTLAIIGSFGLLEIAVNMGNAGARLGLKVGDTVVVTKDA